MKDLERTRKRDLKKAFVLCLENAYNLLSAFANEGHFYLYYFVETKVQLIFTLEVPKIFALKFLY